MCMVRREPESINRFCGRVEMMCGGWWGGAVVVVGGVGDDSPSAASCWSGVLSPTGGGSPNKPLYNL